MTALAATPSTTPRREISVNIRYAFGSGWALCPPTVRQAPCPAWRIFYVLT